MCPEHYAVTLYLVLQLIPVTVFFICVTIFNINITSGPLFGYIVFSQIFLMYKYSVFLDPTLKRFCYHHIQFIMVSSVPLFIFTLLPSLLHIIYPTRIYEYLLRCISARKRLAITAFTEALQACFKDSLNRTRDYRALPGLIPVFLLIYIVSIEILNNGFGWSPAVSSAFFAMFTGCVFLYLQPFKQAIGTGPYPLASILFCSAS